MTWYESFLLTPVRAVNNIRSNVWAVILIITGISLVLHGHENIGNSLITGAFAVFRSSNTDTAPIPYNADPAIVSPPKEIALATPVTPPTVVKKAVVSEEITGD